MTTPHRNDCRYWNDLHCDCRAADDSGFLQRAIEAALGRVCVAVEAVQVARAYYCWATSHSRPTSLEGARTSCVPSPERLGPR